MTNTTDWVEQARLYAISAGQSATGLAAVVSVVSDAKNQTVNIKNSLDATVTAVAQDRALAEAAATSATEVASSVGLSYTQQSLNRRISIYPSSSWNGTVDSGWVTQPTASSARAFTDPARPELAPFYVYDRCAFNSRKRILFNVEERDPLYPVNMRVYLNGNTVDVPNDTLEHYIGDDGIERTAWVRAFDLDHANFAMDGKCRFYVEAIPSDPTMSSRIIGPFDMKRKTGNLWDAILTFGPGGTYSDFMAARTAAVTAPYNTSSYEHIWLKPASSHDYDVIGRTTPLIYNRWGKTLIDGSPGIVWRVHASEWRTTGSTFEPNLDGIIFGPSCEFDMRRMVSVITPRATQGAVQTTHFAGCRLYDPNGKDTMFGGGFVLPANSGSTLLTNPDAKSPRITTSFVFQGNVLVGPYSSFSECSIEYCSRSPITGAPYARNNVVIGNNEDIFSPQFMQRPGVTWGICYGNIAYNCGSDSIRAGIDSISITYTGLATTATVEFFGNNDASGNRIYLRENGVIKYTVAVSITLGTGNYSVSDVVGWINTNCPGWTATTLNDTRRASYFNAKAQTNAKNVQVVNYTWIDFHMDGWQLSLCYGENYVAKNNQFYDCGAIQIFFLALQSSTATWRDCLWRNNLVQFSEDSGTTGISGVLSQFEGRFSNVRVENNYCLQGFYVRTQSGTTTFDDKCTIEANIMKNMNLETGTSLGSCSVKYNQSIDSTAVYPTGTNVASNLVSTVISSDPVRTRAAFDINNDRRTVISRRGPFR